MATTFSSAAANLATATADVWTSPKLNASAKMLKIISKNRHISLYFYHRNVNSVARNQIVLVLYNEAGLGLSSHIYRVKNMIGKS